MHTWIKKFGPILLLVAVMLAIPLATAHAQSLFGIPSISEIVEGFVANAMNLAISAMSLLVLIAGMLLNFSINLTLNIKSFVDSTPAIYTTWRTIRDISGMFLIFFLLYAAFQLIIGVKKPNFGELIRNIVMAGILINFSFFFAGLGIDVSNIVSVQIYNAIAPANSLNASVTSGNILDGSWSRSLDGGLSDIFMNSLKVQSVYRTKFAPTTNASSMGQAVANGVSNGISATIASAPVKVFLMGVIAVMIEFVAAISFAAAACAFIFRFVVLILLLAFSPIWMLGFLPEVGSYTKKWVDHYKAMLIFMPVYLLLMYVALNVLTTSNLFGGVPTSPIGATSGSPVSSLINSVYAQQATTAGSDAWYAGLLSLGVNAAIVIFLLNMPLAAAASIAGGVIGMLKKAQQNYGASALWSKFGSQVGSRTLGRAAYAAANSERVAQIAGFSPILGSAITGGLAKVSKSGFGQKKGGYEDRLKTRKENEEKLHKQIGTLDETKYDNKKKDAEGKTALDRAKAVRKEAQEQYRENLPWKPRLSNLGMGGVIGFMVDNRANRQASAKLGKEAEKQEKKERAKKEKEEMTAINREMNDVTNKLRELDGPISSVLVGDAKDRVIRLREGQKKALQDRLRELTEKRDKYQADIEEARAIEDEEREAKRNDAIASAVAEKTKPEGGGGGGEGGEKKEEKKEDA